MRMTSSKPYFIRALYDWIVDNDCTPYIAVDATLPHVEVPTQFVNEGKIILNILPSAVHQLVLDDEWITFSARFSGVSEKIFIPIGAVIAIYAQENGQGMGFEPEPLSDEEIAEIDPLQPKRAKTKETSPQHLSVIEGENEEASQNNQKPPKKGSKKEKKPTLTIIE